MRALHVADGRVGFRDDIEPQRPPGETRVRVLTAGICATDLALARGYMDFAGVPGHEFVGVALEGPLEGRRVVGEINVACGACRSCRGGLRRHCPRRTVLGILGRPGAFAEEISLPAANLHPVPDSVPTERAVFTEPLAAAFEIAEQIPLGPLAEEGATTLVLGDGRLGLLCAQVLLLHGLAVDLAGRHPERTDLLESLPGRIRHLGPLEDGRDPGRFQLVVEATGDPTALGRALALVRPRGTIVLKTTCEAPVPLDLAPLVVDEVRLVGSRCGPFAPALEAIATGRLVLEPLIAARFPLEDGPRAFQRAGRSGTLKVLIEVAEG